MGRSTIAAADCSPSWSGASIRPRPTHFRKRHRTRGKGLNAALLAAGLLFAVEGQAQVPGEVRLYSENDFFNPFTERTDRYYTQGLRLEWLYPSSKSGAHFLPGISHSDWCSLVCGAHADAALGNVNTGFAFGQNMYTPADITIAAPQPFDRPWAGLLYGSRIARIRYEEPTLRARRQDRIEVSLGIVGPASLAKETQIWWHDVIDDDRPNGWDNQLRNEPVVQLGYETALRWQTKRNNADLIPRVRGNLGNALTSLEADVTARLGWNLIGFGVPSIPPPGPPPAAFAMDRRTNVATDARWRPSGNLFVRAGIKAVAHNIFLDGNTFASNDIRIRRKTLVPEIAGGVEMNLIGSYWLTFQFIRRGSEFETRSGRKAPAQDFGSITLARMIGN